MMPMGSMDPAQQKMLKLMPLIFGVFMFTFPSGLVLYFSMNILLTIFQQWLIRVQHDDTTLLQEAK
jgi:YidC/Oxa1 family membrane protein insertase